MTTPAKRPFGFLLPLFLAGLIVFAVIGPVYASSNSSQDWQTVSFFFENDLFADTDKYYTNAVQLTWVSPDLERYRDDVRLPQWTLPIIRCAPFVNVPDSTHNMGLLLGQHIYTPSDIRTTIVDPDERPYAGFLYSGLALHSKTTSQLDTLEAVVGIVGPSALGEEAQNTVHSLRGLHLARGWDSQLHDEPALRLAWQRKHRLWQWTNPNGFGADCLPHIGATLGNVKTALNAGGEFRLGYRLPQDFGTDTIRPGAGISAPLPTGPATRWGRLGVHLFAGVNAQVIARNIFLDGNTWRHSRHVDKRFIVGEISAGVAVTFEQLKITYRHVFRTQEFEHQDRGHAIGSMAVTWAF